MNTSGLDTIPSQAENTDFETITALPKELGFLLIVAGIGGILLPGPVGAPFLILGGAVLFPNVFRRIDRSFARQFPNAHKESMRQVKRYLTDMDRRYPIAK